MNLSEIISTNSDGSKTLVLSRQTVQKIPEEVLKYESPQDVTTIFLTLSRFTSLHGLGVFSQTRQLHMNYSIDVENWQPEEEEQVVKSPVGGRILIKKESSGTVTRSRRNVKSDTKVVDETKSATEEVNKIWAQVKDSKKTPLVKLPLSEFKKFHKLTHLYLAGCSLSPVSCNQVISHLSLVTLILGDNPTLGAYLTAPLPANVQSEISTFSVDALSSSFGTASITSTQLSSSTTTTTSEQESTSSHSKPESGLIDLAPDSSWSFFKSLRGTLLTLHLPQCDMHSFPLSVCQLFNLTELDLSNNSIKRIPDQISKMTSLKHLNLDQTKLSEFPSPIFSLSSLIDLSISRNNISVLSEEVAQLNRLKRFHISYNDLSEFPPALEAFSETFLNVCGNPFCVSTVDSEFKPVQLSSIPYVRVQTSIPDEILPQLYLGDIDCCYNKHCLTQLGVTHVLSILPKFFPPYPHKFKYMVVDLEDRDTSDLKKHFVETTKFIKETIGAGNTVLVHCAAGISRSATAVIAYLVAEERMTVQTALEFVRKKRNIICPNSGFLRQLEEWEAQEMPLYHWANKITHALF